MVALMANEWVALEGEFHLIWPLVPLYIIPPPFVDERRVLRLPEQEDRLSSRPLSSLGQPSLQYCVDERTNKLLESVMGLFGAKADVGVGDA
jgi:hypothetical protein